VLTVGEKIQLFEEGRVEEPKHVRDLFNRLTTWAF
jgi:hypothetical protein